MTSWSNERGAGKRGIRALFHTGRTCPALPEDYLQLVGQAKNHPYVAEIGWLFRLWASVMVAELSSDVAFHRDMTHDDGQRRVKLAPQV